jgi:hypothetical protein
MTKSGTNVMISITFSPKKLAKILAFLAQNTANYAEKVITLGY